MNITRRVFLAAGTALALVGLGQFSGNTPVVAQTGVINVYSARHYDTDNQLYANFTKKTGIKINLVEAEADKLIERIKSEGANTPADVLITVDAGRLWRAKEAGVLQPVSSRVLSRNIPSYLRDPQNQWFGLTKRARVIVYNKNKVNPSQLSTYEALTQPRWKGRVLVRSSNNIYNQSMTGSILAVYGPQRTEQWARGLVANFARQPEGGDTDQIKAVAAGVGDVAISNTYYLIRLAKSSKPEDQAVAKQVGIFFPNQRGRGTHINISGAGVVKNAPNKTGAVKFLEYLASREAQEIFAKGNNEYPVLAGVPIDPVLASYGTFKADKLNAAVFAKNNAEALRVMDRAGWK